MKSQCQQKEQRFDFLWELPECSLLFLPIMFPALLSYSIIATVHCFLAFFPVLFHATSIFPCGHFFLLQKVISMISSELLEYYNSTILSSFCFFFLQNLSVWFVFRIFLFSKIHSRRYSAIYMKQSMGFEENSANSIR